MTPLTSDEKKWILVCVIFMLIIGYLFYIFVWNGNTKRIAQLNLEINGTGPTDEKSLQNKLIKYKQIVEGPESQAQIAELTAKIALFEKRLPEKREIPSLLTFFRQAADDSGTKFVTINALAQVTSEYYVEIPFQVSLKAKYHSLGQFINKVENHERFMRVDNPDLKSASDEPMVHNATIRVSTFMFNQGG